MSSQKEQIGEGSYFSQLIHKVALQEVRDILEKYGYSVEFVKVKTLGDKKVYGKGLDSNLMRDRAFLESVVADVEGDIKKHFVKKVKNTVVIAYTNSVMNLVEIENPYNIQRQGEVRVDNKYLVGYQYVEAEQPVEESGTIKDFDEVFPQGVQISEITKEKPPKTEDLLAEYRDSVMEDKGYILAKIIKDMVYVSLGVQMSLITASESDVHNLQFLLLKNLCDLNSDTVQHKEISYDFDKSTQPLRREVTYKISELDGVDTMGDATSGLYNINFNFEDIRAELFSDYSYLVPIEETLQYKVLFKIGLI